MGKREPMPPAAAPLPPSTLHSPVRSHELAQARIIGGLRLLRIGFARHAGFYIHGQGAPLPIKAKLAAVDQHRPLHEGLRVSAASFFFEPLVSMP